MKSQESRYEDVVGKRPRPIWTVAIVAALLLVAAGTLIPLITVALAGATESFNTISPMFKYIFTAGALLLLVARLFTPYTGNALRVKRLRRIEVWSAIFFCVAAFFLFYEPYTTRDWLAFTMAGGAVQAYVSIMLPIAIKKELKAQ